MLCRNVHVRTRWYLTTQVVTTEVITARGNGDDALSSLRSTIQCRGRDANPLRSALQVPRNTSRRDIRIETANTNVSLMHCAVWIRNRRQASRRVASPRRDEAPAQKFPRIQDVRARTRARVCVCVYVLSSQYRDLSRICVHIARRARSAFSRSNSVALLVSEICAWIIISVLRCSHGISKETSKADKKNYIYIFLSLVTLESRAQNINIAFERSLLAENWNVALVSTFNRAPYVISRTPKFERCVTWHYEVSSWIYFWNNRSAVMLRVWNISCFIMLYVSHYYRDVFSAHDVLKGGRHGKTKTLPFVDEIETRINLPTVKALVCSCIKCGSWRKKKIANSTVTNRVVARLQPPWMGLREERVRNKGPPSIPQRAPGGKESKRSYKFRLFLRRLFRDSYKPWSQCFYE